MKPFDPKAFAWAPGPHVILGKELAGTNIVVSKLRRELRSLRKDAPVALVWDFNFGSDLHYSVIRDRVREMYDSKDAFVYTTMNTAAVDPLGFLNVEQVMQTLLFMRNGVVCTLEPEEAHCFFGAYHVGIQHVSEILITQGLW